MGVKPVGVGRVVPPGAPVTVAWIFDAGTWTARDQRPSGDVEIGQIRVTERGSFSARTYYAAFEAAFLGEFPSLRQAKEAVEGVEL